MIKKKKKKNLALTKPRDIGNSIKTFWAADAPPVK